MHPIDINLGVFICMIPTYAHEKNWTRRHIWDEVFGKVNLAFSVPVFAGLDK
jgi:hypothetical protein